MDILGDVLAGWFFWRSYCTASNEFESWQKWGRDNYSI